MPHETPHDELAELKYEIRRLRRRLDTVTPDLMVALRRRGFHIYKKNPADDLLLPDAAFLDDWYVRLHKYSFRLFLRDVIKHQRFFTSETVARYASAGVTQEYIDYLLGIGLAVAEGGGYRLRRRHVKSFGQTLEWYVAELFGREFGCQSLWGVKFKRPLIGGDYDVLAKLDGEVLYAEVKSSPPKQIYDAEIAAFFDRVADLSPAVSIFFLDTELRMKDKIVPMFEKELARRHRTDTRILRIEKELFEIGDRIFIINAKDSVIKNIETVLSLHFRQTMTPVEEPV
jgi:hypothetical protein